MIVKPWDTYTSCQRIKNYCYVCLSMMKRYSIFIFCLLIFTKGKSQGNVKYNQVPIISCKGFFNSNLIEEQLNSYTPLEIAPCNRTVLFIEGSELIFNDLIPSIYVAKKVTEPYEILIFRNDTLSLTFSSSEFGHNEFYNEKFTFVYNEPNKYFYLVNYEISTCIIPDCVQIAKLTILMEDLKIPKASFSYTEWGIDEAHVRITEQNRTKFEMYAKSLKNMGIYFNDEWLKP